MKQLQNQKRTESEQVIQILPFPISKQIIDDFNRLMRVRSGNSTGNITEEYLYDSNGQRLLKIEVKPIVNQTTYYIGDSFIHIVNSSGTFNQTFYYADGVLIAEKDISGNNKYYHPDHLGSTSLITNQSGNIVEETFYQPFGDVLDGGNESRYGYTSKEKDSTNLNYYEARFYKSSQGQFVQPDSNLPNIYNPQYLNRYAYVLNNPYKYVDPNGEVAVLITGASNQRDDMLSLQQSFYSDDIFTQSNLPSGVQDYGRGLNPDTFQSFNYVQGQLQKNSNQPVVIVGHSEGAFTALQLSNILVNEGLTSANNIHVFTIDPAGFGTITKTYEGTKVTNFYTRSLFTSVFGREISNANNIFIKGVGHTTIDQNKNVVNSISSQTQNLHAQSRVPSESGGKASNQNSNFGKSVKGGGMCGVNMNCR